SGEPLTLMYTPLTQFQVSGIQQDFRGANNYRPNVIGSPYGDRNSVTNYLNRETVIFPPDPSQPFGNAKRNSARAPWFWQVDFVAAKDFPIPAGNETRVQIRFEAFNLFNRTNFRAANGNRSAAAFGTITQTYDARQLQLGIKLSF
ncbi:MAG: TonB-dependent receptor, partial [Acidimicrobiia bacterium]